MIPAQTELNIDLRSSVVNTEALVNCPLCNSGSHAHWAEGMDRLYRVTEQRFKYSLCNACGVIFQSVRPLASEVVRFYPQQYGPYGKRAPTRTWSNLPPVINRALSTLARRIIYNQDYSRRMDALQKTMQSSKTVLDFGCGSGKFLDHARSFGCATIGMDFSETALEDVRRRGHQALSVDDASWDQIPAGSVDFVLLNHVIEHLYDVAGVLRHIYRVMAPGATLHIATPNPRGIGAETYREAWWGLECPRHITLFPPQQLAETLTVAGFKEVEILHEPIVKDLARSWAYRQVDLGKMSHDRVEGLFEDGLLMLLFARRAAKANREGRSDRIHAIARKN